MIINKFFFRIRIGLVNDFFKVTRPDFITPFKSTNDVIKRLLPYHIFQYPNIEFPPSEIDINIGNLYIDNFLEKNRQLELKKKSEETFDKIMKIVNKKEVYQKFLRISDKGIN